MERIRKFNDITHAGIRSRERGISFEDMKNSIQYHDNRKQQYRGNHGGMVFKFKKTVGDKTMAVVAEVKHDECWILTGFFV
jgi:hypothetical protein